MSPSSAKGRGSPGCHHEGSRQQEEAGQHASAARRLISRLEVIVGAATGRCAALELQKGAAASPVLARTGAITSWQTGGAAEAEVGYNSISTIEASKSPSCSRILPLVSAVPDLLHAGSATALK